MAFLLVLLPVMPAAGQQSASYELTEHVFNAGGHPTDGTVPTSASFQITLDSIGDPLGMAELSGNGLWLSGSFVGRYRPPGEVSGLVFSDKTTVSWNPESSAGDYNLYSGQVQNLPGSFGNCDQQDLTVNSAVVNASPAAGVTAFYLVTVENGLGEEGTRGYQGNGSERTGAPCP